MRKLGMRQLGNMIPRFEGELSFQGQRRHGMSMGDMIITLEGAPHYGGSTDLRAWEAINRLYRQAHAVSMSFNEIPEFNKNIPAILAAMPPSFREYTKKATAKNRGSL